MSSPTPPTRLAIRACRIAAPEKLPDRFLLSGLLSAQPPLKLDEGLILAYLFEVSKPWLPSSHLFPALVKVLEEEYPHLTLDHPLDDQFELLLRSVNQQLNQVSEQGETDWIGSLNGIILVLGRDEVHFSQTGHYPAYILQNNRIRQITDDAPSEGDLHPLKTFSNLASGHLQDGDHLLVANQDLYSEISLDALRRIMNSGTAYQGCQAIAHELKKERNPHVSALILDVLPDSALATEPQVVDLAEEMQSSYRKLLHRLTPFARATRHGLETTGSLSARAAARLGKASVNAARRAQAVTRDTLIPQTEALVDKGVSHLKERQKKARSGAHPVVEIILPPSQRTSAPVETEVPSEESADSTVGAVIPASQFQSPASPGPGHRPGIKHFFLRLLPYYFLTGLHKTVLWLQVPRNKKLAALGLALILVGATVWGALVGRHHTSSLISVSANDTTLTTLQTLSKKIDSDVQLGQKDPAATEITSAYTKLETLSHLSNAQQAQADALWTSITTRADQLSLTTRLSAATATYSFPQKVDHFIENLPYFYGWKDDGKTVYRTGKGNLDQIRGSVDLSDTSDAIVSLGTTSETDTAGYLLSRQNKVYRVVQIGTDTSLRSISPQEGNFATGSAITTYSGNVYILDEKSGLLWRYANSGTSYSRGTSIIDINKYDIRDSTSVTIDGSIYLLKQNGSVLKFTGGKQDTTFTLHNLPSYNGSFVRPLQIYTDPNLSSFFVLDGGSLTASHTTARILEFSKDGGFVRQYGFPVQYTRVEGFAINPKDNVVWILNDGALAEFTLTPAS